jgi:hypothetical protein
MLPAPLSKATLIAVGALLFAVYFLAFGVLDDGMILGNDALPYAQHLANGDGGHALWNPHHLLFHPLAALLAALLSPFESASSGLRTPMALAMTAQTILSALGGALCVLAFLRTALSLSTRTRLVPMLLAGLLAMSSSFWLYASVGETYLPAVAAEAALLGLVLRIALRDPAAVADEKIDERKENHTLIAFLLLATLLRQDSALIVLPLFVALPLRRAFRVAATSGALCLGFYLLAFNLTGSTVDFAAWMRGLADTGLWGGALTWDSVTVAFGMLGASLSYPLWFTGNAAQTGAFTWSDHGAQLALGLAPWLLIGTALIASRLRKERDASPSAKAARALVVLIVVRFAFFTWWQPSNMEYYCGTLMPLFFLAALWLRDSGPSATVPASLLAVALGILALGNWATLISPNRGGDMDARARETLQSAGPSGLALGLDRLGYYSLMRARETSTVPAIELPRVVDISDAASGVKPDQVPLARALISQTIAAKGNVFAMRDMVLPVRFRHAPWFLDWSVGQHEGAMSKIIADFEATPMDPDAGLGSWLWRLR